MRFNYSLKDGEAIITGASEVGTIVAVPREIEGHMVTSIDRKALLGIKGLRTIEVPETVTEIGDWAFAQCIHLREVTIAGSMENRLGRGVFEGCTRLEKINIECEDESGDCGVLAAMSVHRIPSEHLLRDSEIGSLHWFEKWDLGLSNFLAQDDMEGFNDTALCGEEDISYDGVGMVDGEMPGETIAFVIEKNKNKCYLCLTRLMHSKCLSDNSRTIFSNYLKKHALGAGNGSAWLTIKEDFKDDIEYLKLFVEVTEPDNDAIQAMIDDAGNLAEIKAYLISLVSGKDGGDDFFDDLFI